MTWMRYVAPWVRFAAVLMVAVRPSAESDGDPAAWATGVEEASSNRTVLAVIDEGSIASLKTTVGSTAIEMPVAPLAGVVEDTVGATTAVTVNKLLPVL